MKNLLLNLQFIFMPGYWLMNARYNEKLDKFMNDLMDKHTFKDADEYTAKLGNCEIWITNRPYACMIPHKLITTDCRPSRLTVLRGIRKLKREIKLDGIKNMSDIDVVNFLKEYTV